MTMRCDAIVIGGSLVGTAIAYGLTRHDLKPVVLDEGDTAFRAARGNFGLVWVQSKGVGAPAYQRWSRGSSELWPEFAAELREVSGIDPMHERRGGTTIYLSEEELDKRRRLLEQMKEEQGSFGFDYEVLSASELKARIPVTGPEAVGAVYTHYDGAANPLRLLRGLHTALLKRGGEYVPHSRVTAIAAKPNDFTVTAGGRTWSAPRLVLAAGLGNRELGPLVGLNVPVRPVRGTLIVTERVQPVIPLTHIIRQMPEGGLLIGDSYEEAGYDDTIDTPRLRDIAARAVRIFPFLRGINIVRTWAALRVMSPDVLPIYDQSRLYPGAFVATCHSGVTLAANHALRYAGYVAGGGLPPLLAPFSAARFRHSAAIVKHA